MRRTFRALVALLALGVATMSVPAAKSDLVVEYQFTWEIDQEGVMDGSGHGHTGMLMLDERQFVQTPEGHALEFKEKTDRVEAPWQAFPGAKGRAVAKVRFRKIQGKETIMRVYTTGDGMILGLRDGYVEFSYYNRKAGKWNRVGDKRLTPRLEPNEWYTITASWDLSKGGILEVDGKRVHRRGFSYEPNFSKEGFLTLGNDRLGSSSMKGMIGYFALYNEPLPWDEGAAPTAAAPAKAPAAKQAAAPKATGGERTYSPDNAVVLANDRLRLIFDKDALVPVGAWRVTGDRPILSDRYRPDEPTLWRLQLRNQGGHGDIVALSNHAEAKRSIAARDVEGGKQAVLKWADMSAPGVDGPIAVTVTVDLPDDSDFSHWRIAVDRRPGDWRLWQVDFPVATLAPPDGDTENLRFLHPYRWGINRHDPFLVGRNFTSDITQTYRYPSSNMQMQLFALMGAEGGTYMATYDGAGYAKQCKFTWQPRRLRTVCEVSGYPSNEEQVQAHYEQPYPFVLGGFEGDWYDAATIYRDWALEQRWCSKGPLIDRKDQPQWLRENSILLKTNRVDPGNVPGALNFIREFGAPICTMWYNWIDHSIQKDTATPNGAGGRGRFTPALPGMKEAVTTLREAGARSCCYIQSKIYDQGTEPLDEDARKMKAATVLDENGDIIFYNKTSINCWSLNQSSDLWRDRLVALSEKALRDYNFTGVYLDSFGRGMPKGFHPVTGEPVGRGTEQLVGPLGLVRRVRDAIRKIDPEAIVISEASIEFYVDAIDLRLMHENAMIDGCPLFHAVYHDYQYLYGRSFDSDKGNHQGFRMALASIFTVGAMLGRFHQHDGYITPWLPEDKPKLDYARPLIHLREQCVDFFNFGRMLRPATLSPEQTLVDGNYKNSKFRLPEVMTSSWSLPDGRVAVALVSIAEAPRTVTATFDAADYGFKPGQTIAVIERTADKSKDAGSFKAETTIAREATLAPLQAIVWELQAR